MMKMPRFYLMALNNLPIKHGIIQEFDSKFSKLFTQMVKIAFGFVNRNVDEVVIG